MRRTLCTAALVALLATPAFADVTLNSTMTGKGFGKMADGESVSYISGLKMRTDSTFGGSPTSIIIDLDAQKFISINHKKKEAQVYDMAKFRQDLDKTLKQGETRASLKPNGEKREVSGRACTGYDMNVAVPFAMGGGGEGTEMTMVMSGPVFIAKGAPGSADYARFYLAAAEKGFIASDPRAAKGAASQTKGMTELYKAIAETGGIPYLMETGVKLEGTSPMAGVMGKMMGGSGFSQTITSVTTDAIPADKFTIPADYKTKIEK
jgi:hypothetical protein